MAYKFRSPEQIEFTLDILFNDRLYCADWSTLNDPMEGEFFYSHNSTDETDYSTKLDELRIEKKKIYICSLSKTYDSHLLWAHYADGFSGMAIEVELCDDAQEIASVDYGGVFSHVNIADDFLPSEKAKEILSSKYNEWSYEKEVRILHDSHQYKLTMPVRRIIVGHRMDPSLFEGLRIICEKKNILINRTGIGDEGIDADSVPALGDPW